MAVGRNRLLLRVPGMTDFKTSVALAWAEYTSSVGIAPEKFTDTERIAFQAGYAARAAEEIAAQRKALQEEA